MDSDKVNIEKELVDRLKKGDKAAFAQLYDMYSQNLFGISAKITGSEELAADALQDSFIKIWKNIHKYDASKGRLFTWLLNITRNTSIDVLRKVKKEGKVEIQTLDFNVNISSGHQTEIKINEIGVKELIATLAPEQQETLEYLYFRGFTQQEAADALNVPLGTIKTRSRIAVRELKKLFNDT